MKNIFVLLLLVVVTQLSCKNNDSIEPAINSVRINAPSAKNGRLIFDSYQDFLSVLRTSDEVRNKIADAWQNTPGFTSLEKYKFVRYQEYIKGEKPAASLQQSPPLLPEISVAFLGKVVDPRGIVEIEGKLFYFSKLYTKVATEFKGDESEINKLLVATETSTVDRIYVQKNEITSLKATSPKARQFGSFNDYVEGNTIIVLFGDSGSSTGFGYQPAYVRGYVDAVRNNIPTNYCQGPNGTYVCGYEYTYSVTTHADMYAPDYGVWQEGTQYTQISWTTDRGNGYATQSGTICSSGSGQFGIQGVTPFSDIEGTVNFSFSTYYSGGGTPTSTSSATISM